MHSNFITPPDYIENILIVNATDDLMTAMSEALKGSSQPYNIYFYNDSMNERDWFDLIKLVFNSIVKKNKKVEILGCTPEFLKEYLEKQFTEGMTWENHGLYGWHIDHIIPLSSATTKEEVIKLNHYSNLQPLWAIDNLKKGGIIKPPPILS